MPLRDYHCPDCGITIEYLIRSDADVPTRCPDCSSEKIEQKISAHGGYSMDSGPASVRPRGAGAFKGGSK
jgi:putative FmdB family regulatory protein